MSPTYIFCSISYLILIILLDITKGGLKSEDTGEFLLLQNKYSKSLSWAENLNKLLTVLDGKFKFSAQNSDLEYLFWICKNPPTSSDLKPPLYSDAGTRVGQWGYWTPPPPYLSGQLTLIQPGEGRLSPPIITGIPNFFYLLASLLYIRLWHQRKQYKNKENLRIKIALQKILQEFGSEFWLKK